MIIKAKLIKPKLMVSLAAICLAISFMGGNLAAQAGPEPPLDLKTICGHGDLNEVKAFWQRLVQGDESAYRDKVHPHEARKTCFGFAGMNPRLEVLGFLIGTGLDPNTFFRTDTPEQSGHTPLIMAAWGNPEPKAAEMLIEAGAEVNKYGHYENLTPLLAASQYNPNPEMVKTLLAAGADLELVSRPRDISRLQPLSLAAMHNPNPLVAEALLDAGADLNYVSEAPLVPGPALALAAGHNPNPEVFKLFLSRGADLGKAGGRAALIIRAARNPNHLVLAETLKLEDGSDRPDSETLAEALHESILYCRPASAVLLADNGAPLNDRSRVEIARTALLFIIIASGGGPNLELIEAEGRLNEMIAPTAEYLGQAYGPVIEAAVKDFKPRFKSLKNSSYPEFELSLASSDGRVHIFYTTKSHHDSAIKIIRPKKGTMESYKCAVGVVMGKPSFRKPDPVDPMKIFLE